MIYSEYKNMQKKITTILLTLLFVTVMFGGLFNLSAGMSLTGNSDMSGCLFMDHGQALCSMSALEHLGEWQSSFLVMIPVLTWLLAAAVATAIFFSIAPVWLSRKRTLRQEISIVESSLKILTFPKRPLQELFSNGVLHPKLF